jgi:long-chain acyl-CoA synthetase
MDTIGENLKEVKPQMFVTVPRLLEKVYDRIMHKGAELTGVKKKLFYWAHDLAARYEINKPMGAWYNLQLSLANKLIFSKWREALGNNVVAIVSGGAACQVQADPDLHGCQGPHYGRVWVDGDLTGDQCQPDGGGRPQHLGR